MFDNRYLYSVARTRVLETKLLDKNKIEQMIEAKDAQDVFRVLSDTAYADGLAQIKDVNEYEGLLLNELISTYDYIKEVAPDPTLSTIFLLKYDVHNLKVLFKSNILKQDNDHLLMDVGNISVSKLKEMFKEEDFRDLQPELQLGVKAVYESLETAPNPQEIDLILDRALYQAIFYKVHVIKNEFLGTYFQAQVDLINIKTFIRIKSMGYGRDYLTKVILRDGLISLAFYEQIFDDAISALPEKLQFTKYGSVVTEGIELYSQSNNLTGFEKLADNYSLALAHVGKYVAFGLEPLVAYLLARETEIKIVRIIMVGKINYLSNEMIRERVRDVYV